MRHHCLAWPGIVRVLLPPHLQPIPGEIRSCAGFHPSSCHFAIYLSRISSSIILVAFRRPAISSCSSRFTSSSVCVHCAACLRQTLRAPAIFSHQQGVSSFTSATCIIVIAPPTSSTSPLHHSLPSGQPYDLLNHSFISTATTSRFDSKYLDGWLLTAGRPSYHLRLSIYQSIS